MSGSLTGTTQALDCDSVKLDPKHANDPAMIQAAKDEQDAKQKETMGKMINQTTSMLEGLSTVMGPTLTINSSNVIKSDAMEVSFAKASLETLKEPVKLEQGGFVGPDFAEVFASNNNDSNSTNVTMPSSLIQQAVMFGSAMAGNNAGLQGASISNSPSIGLSYSGSGGELKVSNLSKPVDIWIKRSTTLPLQDYSSIDVENIKDKSNLITYKFDLVGTPVSTHIQLKPLLRYEAVYYNETFNSSNDTTASMDTVTEANSLDTNFTINNTRVHLVPIDEYPGYVFILKFGAIAQLTSTTSSYDEFKILCPQGKSFFHLLL